MVIPFDKATVKDAPQVEDDSDGHLTPAEEQELYRYYDQARWDLRPSQKATGRDKSRSDDRRGHDAFRRARQRGNSDY